MSYPTYFVLTRLEIAVALGVALFAVLVISLLLEWRTDRIAEQSWDEGYAFARARVDEQELGHWR